MTDTTNICEAIKGLPDNDRLRLHDRPVYKSDEWGMNRYLTTVCDAYITTNDLKALVAENEALRERVADANRGAQVNALVNESLAKKLKLAVEALKVYADVENWNEEQFEAFDAEGIEWSSVRFVFDNGDSDDSPISVARTALAKIKEPSKGRDV